VNLSEVAAGSGGFVITGIAQSTLLGSVSGAGDVNGDGLDDVIVAVAGYDHLKGDSYVVLGKTDGAAVDLADVADGNGGFVINGFETFGYGGGTSVSDAGDVNGDGLADVVLGVPGDPFTGDAGESYVVFSPFEPSCPWDLDGDGTVGVSDLLSLIVSFGPCGAECPADFNEDGVVNTHDLLELLFNFGPCPDGGGCPWDVNGDGTVDFQDLWHVLANLGPCDGCPEDINGDGVVNGEDVAAVITHFGRCP
jgi:hypothetical protein